MSLKELGGFNSDRFLREAFDAETRKNLIRGTRLRRNTYLSLFLTGFVCIFVSGFAGLLLLSILSLFLGTLSLVVMSKYDTQLFFLKILEKKDTAENP